jgi:4-hydroxybenzoyl-CoA reductase subunit alpha
MAADTPNQSPEPASAAEAERPDLTRETWQIGKVHRKVDAMERMRGVARYTDDLKLPGLLHAKILRSPHAHAKIRRIDASAALALPGVFAVVTGQDFKIPYGVIPWTPDENALAVHKVCHVGDGVAAVAAIDEDTANAALRAIVVDYEPLRAFFDPEEALATREREHTINPYARKGNLSKHVLLEFGDVDAQDLPAPELVVEGEYFFEGTTHAPIEPHCALAQVEPNGILTVWSGDPGLALPAPRARQGA